MPLPVNTECQHGHQQRPITHNISAVWLFNFADVRARILCSITDRRSNEEICDMFVLSMCWFESGLWSMR
jgi:hypothetical protein